jgi:hypothetical protein
MPHLTPASRFAPRFLWLLLPLLLLLAACGGTTPATPTRPARPVGIATRCQGLPRFLEPVGLSQQVAIDTTNELAGHVLLRDMQQQLLYAHPSWVPFGPMGGFSRDRSGHIYVAPIPFVDQDATSMANQYRLFRVDSDTGEMAPFFEVARPADTTANPYGMVGLAYDCATDSLYASSLAGSTRRDELGVLYQIDPATGTVTSQLEGIDAVALIVFNGRDGTRLYYGSARTPNLFSVGLDEQGRLTGEPRYEFSLAELSGGNVEHALRLQINEANQMTLKAYRFDYSPIAAGQLTRNVYTFAYDASADSWTFLTLAPEE